MATPKNSGDQQPPAPQPRRAAPAPRSNRWQRWLLRLLAPGLTLAAGVLFIVALGLAQRVGWIAPADGGGAGTSSSNTEQIYTCPMHPQIRQPHPGRCPICGMALVPAAGGGGDLDELSLQIDTAQRRLANIQTAPARSGPVAASIETVGAIAIDESRMATISAYIDGRLERLFADYTGVDVAQGDHLAVIYSPELYSAQVEYLESRRALVEMDGQTLPIVRSTQERLIASGRQRLIELGMTEAQIKDLEENGKAQSRLTIYSPIGGTVIEKLAVEGKYVDAGEPIYRIADLSTVWLMLELYPEDAARIRFGQQVTARVQSLPGQTFQGRVAFIDPTVDAASRTVGVRVEFLNKNRRLRPGDYAQAVIEAPIGQSGQVYDADLAGRWISPMHPQIIRDEPGVCPICGMDLVPTSRYGYSQQPTDPPVSLYIPRSALLMAGENSVVYVETEPGRFEIRPVKIGPILRDKVVILAGLKEGEQVATAGNFLIDSQMQLEGKPSLIDPARAVPGDENKSPRPMKIERVDVTAIDGDAGVKLERLYDDYFAVHKDLADDEPPAKETAAALHDLAAELADEEALPETARALLKDISVASEHLHHLDLAKAREAFQPISHATIALAAQVRGSDAAAPLFHFYCPHVRGGGGDWLQGDDDLLNPYYGSKMPHCGRRAHEFPPPE